MYLTKVPFFPFQLLKNPYILPTVTKKQKKPTWFQIGGKNNFKRSVHLIYYVLCEK